MAKQKYVQIGTLRVKKELYDDCVNRYVKLQHDQIDLSIKEARKKIKKLEKLKGPSGRRRFEKDYRNMLRFIVGKVGPKKEEK